MKSKEEETRVEEDWQEVDYEARDEDDEEEKDEVTEGGRGQYRKKMN